MVYTLDLMYLYRDHFKASVYTIWVHEPSGQCPFAMLQQVEINELRGCSCVKKNETTASTVEMRAKEESKALQAQQVLKKVLHKHNHQREKREFVTPSSKAAATPSAPVSKTGVTGATFGWATFYSVYLSVYLPICIYLYLPVPICICLYLSVSVYPFVHLAIFVCACVSTMRLCICVCVCIYVYII